MFSQEIELAERKIFFKQWLKSPSQLGTLAPISKRLAKKGAMSVNITQDDLIVEIGAGTGRWTRALIEQGAKAHQLLTVELDDVMHQFLERTLPNYTHVHGNAIDLKKLIPDSWVGKVTKIVSAIPFMYLDPLTRLKIVQACFECLKNDGELFHLTYNPNSPLDFMPKDQLLQTRVCSLWLNLPPGFVWKYQKQLSFDDQLPLKVA